MGANTRRRKRPRGSIDELPSGSLRVRVYGGSDPLTGREIRLVETIPAGPRAQTEAERTLTRLLNQIDEKRHPRTSATVDQLLDKYLDVIDVEPRTKRGYKSVIGKHVRPVLGTLKVGRVGAEVIDSFYAELRRCRDHCDGKPHVQHRATREHDCDPHPTTACKPADPACRHCQRMCKPHLCKPLGKSSIRQIHWILSGAFKRAVAWDWIAVNPADRVEHPDRPPDKPQPPAVADAAQLIEEAARRDPAWGAFVWVTTTTGARRGEMCALRREDLDLDNKVIHLHRAISLDEDENWVEKETKTHQHRRIVLDDETAEILREHESRRQTAATELGVKLPRTAYVFSNEPDGSRSLIPDTVSQRYDRMAARLGIETTLHKLRHYSATELINAGVDIRTVAGRLGHGGGGATTLRVYAAWLSEADQRAADQLAGRMPARRRNDDVDSPASENGAVKPRDESPSGPYAQIADDLRGAIRIGVLKAGDQLPTIKDLCGRYNVGSATAHRAVQLLKDEGLVGVSRGRRALVL
jgi:integrase